MAIPADWLNCRITRAEVEEGLALSGAPDCWLRQWRTLLGQLEPGDELWEYCGAVSEPWAPETTDEFPDFELVFIGEIDDWNEEWVLVDRIVESYSGFALVRDGEIVDWIGSPP